MTTTSLTTTSLTTTSLTTTSLTTTSLTTTSSSLQFSNNSHNNNNVNVNVNVNVDDTLVIDCQLQAESDDWYEQCYHWLNQSPQRHKKLFYRVRSNRHLDSACKLVPSPLRVHVAHGAAVGQVYGGWITEHPRFGSLVDEIRIRHIMRDFGALALFIRIIHRGNGDGYIHPDSWCLNPVSLSCVEEWRMIFPGELLGRFVSLWVHEYHGSVEDWMYQYLDPPMQETKTSHAIHNRGRLPCVEFLLALYSLGDWNQYDCHYLGRWLHDHIERISLLEADSDDETLSRLIDRVRVPLLHWYCHSFCTANPQPMYALAQEYQITAKVSIFAAQLADSILFDDMHTHFSLNDKVMVIMTNTIIEHALNNMRTSTSTSFSPT